MTAIFFGNTKFKLGALFVSKGAMEALTLAEFQAALKRHGGDDVIHSTFQTKNRTTFWVVTKSDRSVTRVLLPHEDGSDV
jgi:hypothetical protein